MTATRTAHRQASVNERMLATMIPYMLPESEHPTHPLDSFWWRADWEDAETALRAGNVVILSVESGWDAAHAMMAVLYQIGDGVLFRHDEARARLYLMLASAQGESDDSAALAGPGFSADLRGDATLTSEERARTRQLVSRLEDNELGEVLEMMVEERGGPSTIGLNYDRESKITMVCGVIFSCHMVERAELRRVIKEALDGYDAEDGAGEVV